MSVKLYTLPSSTSSRKAKKYLEDNKIEYTECRMDQEPLTWEQLFEILMNTDNGVEDILSARSKDYKMLSEQGIDFDELSLTELHKMIEEYPKLLKAPIMVTKNLVLVGYHEEEIQSLNNREDKKKEFRRVLRQIRMMENKMLSESGTFGDTKHNRRVVAG